MAHLFPSNGDVLNDARVHPIVMDGRAWLRRTNKSYDVITMEPMPPNFAGVNALYSLEFYELAAKHLNLGGLLVQWLPLHLVTVHDAGAIVTTFQRVFPDSILWIDGYDQSGILIGRVGSQSKDFGGSFPGLSREPSSPRDLNAKQVTEAVALNPAGVARWAEYSGVLVTDDNQLLAYGMHRGLGPMVPGDLMSQHYAVIRAIRADVGL